MDGRRSFKVFEIGSLEKVNPALLFRNRAHKQTRLGPTANTLCQLSGSFNSRQVPYIDGI
jgi:hypothetical protein